MTEGIELLNQVVIRTLKEKNTFKYSRVLEADTIKQEEMKEKILKEYLRRTRKLLETKLYCKNFVKRINTWAVPLVRYSGPFLKWTREELKQIDQRTKNRMTMHKALHLRKDVDRLYVSRKEGGRGLASIEDSVDESRRRLEDYIEKGGGRLITATRKNTENQQNRNNQKTEVGRKTTHFKWLTSDISHEKTWTWLRKGNHKRETESLLIAAQNSTITINQIKARIDATNSRCRLCNDREETTNHAISECSKLAQKEYKTRHGWVGNIIHRELCKKLKFDHTKNSICTTQNLSWRMRRTNFSGILRYKWIT